MRKPAQLRHEHLNRDFTTEDKKVTSKYVRRCLTVDIRKMILYTSRMATI